MSGTSLKDLIKNMEDIYDTILGNIINELRENSNFALRSIIKEILKAISNQRNKN